jgi:hypothetical protein
VGDNPGGIHILGQRPVDEQRRTIGGVVVEGDGRPVFKDAKEKSRRPLAVAPPRARNKHFPIHAKAVETMDLQAFQAALSKGELRVWKAVSVALHDGRTLSNWASAGRVRRQPAQDLSELDVMTLVERGYAEECSEDEDGLVFAATFSVDEDRKLRRRVINHTGQINDAAPVAVIALPSLKDIRRAAAKATHAFTADARCWYYQFEVRPELRKFFAFRAGGKAYKLCRMPMGASFSCAIGHFVTAMIADMAARGTGATHLAYIDNYAFFGSREQCEAARRNLLALAVQFNVSLDEFTASQSIVTFVGYEIDLLRRTIRNSLQVVEKVATVEFGRCATYREVLAALGRILGAARLHPWLLSHGYYILKYHRRVSSLAARRGFDSSCVPWPSLSRKIQYFMDCIAKRLTESLDTKPLIEVIVASDASDYGLGWSVFEVASGNFSHGAREFSTWEADRNIAVREALALEEAVSAAKQRYNPTSLRLLVDNTTVFWGLKHGYAVNREVNSSLCRLWSLLDGCAVDPWWVPSALNPADPASRGNYETAPCMALWEQLGAAMAGGLRATPGPGRQEVLPIM